MGTYTGGAGGKPFTYEVMGEIISNRTMTTPDTLSLVSGLPIDLVHAILREMEEQNEVETIVGLFGGKDVFYALRNSS